MNEAYFTFEGKLNKDTLKPFKRELIPYGLNLFINSAITLFGLVAVFTSAENSIVWQAYVFLTPLLLS